MKVAPAFFLFAALAAGGCSHLDLTPHDDPDRILTGTVEFSGGAATLPDDAVVVVRVTDAVPPPRVAPPNTGVQLLKQPVPPPDMPPEVLGEQTIRQPGAFPVAFRVAYRASVEQLQHGLNVDARISYGGRIRYLNLDHTVIGLNDATDPKTIRVDYGR